MYLFQLGYENWNSNRKRTLKSRILYQESWYNFMRAVLPRQPRLTPDTRCEDASKICDWRRNISFFRHWALRRVPTNVSQASTVRQFERSLVMILAMGKSGKIIRNVTLIHWIWIKMKIMNLKWKGVLLKGESRHENCLSNNIQNGVISWPLRPNQMWKSSI